MSTALDDEKLRILSDALYDTVQQHGDERHAFSQKELLGLDIIPHNDPKLLLQVIQYLVNQMLFIAAHNTRQELFWRFRSREDARKYYDLHSEEVQMVYGMIEDAGADGIWSRTVKLRLRMQDSTIKAALKTLEQKGYVTTIMNVEHPSKKMYIKSTLRPSDRATGGPWFNEGELDSAFISELERVTFEYIKRSSAYLSSQSHRQHGGEGELRAPKKGVIRGAAPTNGTAVPRGTKRPAADMVGADERDPVAPPPSSKRIFLPLPAGYTQYPTVGQVAKFIDASGITKNTTLTETDVQQLIDVLVYDGLIEPIQVNRRKGYRVTRATKQDPMPLEVRVKKENQDTAVARPGTGPDPLSNGLTEAPCGRCPVFELCEVGGPVNPGNCVYFQTWLESPSPI